MNVKLISITKSLVEEKELSAEELLVYIARVSNPSNQMNTETSDKLLGYMIKHKHWSPFDMVNMTVQVTTSIAISMQILRHWSIKPQQFSQRYAEVVDIEPIELRKAGATNRQSSSELFDPMIETHTFNCVPQLYSANKLVDDYIEQGKWLYRLLLDNGVAKESARLILPMAASTTLYLNGSVRSWIHYMEQRCDSHAQLEHREVAALIKEIFISNFPSISKALNLHDGE